MADSQDTYVGAIDQGTTGTRFMIFDHGGQVIASAYEQHEQIYPEPRWVEHDAVEIWEKTKQVVTAALEREGIDERYEQWLRAVDRSLGWAGEGS
jgi:glycerol kinase